MSFKHLLRRNLWKTGYDISRFEPAFHPVSLRKKLLESNDIDTVLDVGANSGQYALELRKDLGYKNRIVSFEPLTSAYSLLKTNSARDNCWDIFNFALGNKEEKKNLNISGNSVSSSFLEMLPVHEKSAPESGYIDKETIEIKTLDSIFSSICIPENNIYLKIDTQGFESKVLQGAEKSLYKIDIVQMEMSLVPLYDGEILFNEMCMLMAKRGYSLFSIEPVFSDPETGQLLQLDGVFKR